MGLTAEYAGGSSGAPILNKHGAVVGMAALTLTIDDGGKAVRRGPERRRLLLGQPPKARLAKLQPPVAPPPREKPDAAKPEAPHATVQMILKMGVPGPTILRSFTK